MRRLTLILGVLLVGACGGPLPNGKEGVLFFQAPPDIIQSADYAVTIPSSWNGRYGALGLEVEYDYDFRGTEIETSTTGGLTVLSSSFKDFEYHLRLRCGGEHGKREELRVRIHSGWQTHYRDAIDITCWEPDEMTFVGKGPWIAHSDFYGELKLAFAKGSGQLEVTRQFQDQYYVELTDPEGLLGYAEWAGPEKPQSLSQLHFRTQGPGTHADILLGERRITLPIEVLPDEAWQLQVKLVSSNEVQFPTRGTAHTLQGSAVLPNGDTVRQLDDCQWIVRDGAADGLPEYKSCYVTATTHGSAAVVCARTRGKDACLTLPP